MYPNEELAARQSAGITSVLENLGNSTLRHLEYVGGLTMQLRGALSSLGQVLPVVGNRNRWRSVVRQMLAAKSAQFRSALHRQDESPAHGHDADHWNCVHSYAL
jgi:hypothetical protein